jgi:hypothetical protein
MTEEEYRMELESRARTFGWTEGMVENYLHYRFGED